MDVEEVFGQIPFNDYLGIEITAAADGHAVGTIELREELSSVPGTRIAHGGVTSSLADTVGGAAAMSVVEEVTPTVDIRLDYLAPATDDLTAEAEVVRRGNSVAVVDIDVHDADDHHVATARGVYKTGGDREGTPWLGGAAEGGFGGSE